MGTKGVSYLSTSGQFCDNLSFENISRLLGFGKAAFEISYYASEIITKNPPVGLKDASRFFDGAGLGVSLFRVFASIEKLITGKMFWKQEKGSFEIGDEGKPHFLYYKNAEGKATEQLVKKGDFIKLQMQDDIYQTENGIEVRQLNGHKQQRDWELIAIDLILLIPRFLSPTLWLHRLKLIDLGKHTQWMGGVILSAYTSITVLYIGYTARKYIEEPSRSNLADMVSGVLDGLALPWDVITSSNPVVCLVNAGFQALSAGGYLLKEWVYTT